MFHITKQRKEFHFLDKSHDLRTTNGYKPLALIVVMLPRPTWEATAKNVQTTTQLHSFHTLAK